MSSVNYADVLDKSGPLVEFYRQNPCIAAYDLLNVDLAPIQRIIFEAMWFKPYTLVVASRGLGKSFLSGLLSVLLVLLKPGYRVGLVGPAFRQAKQVFSEVEKLYDNSSIFREACYKPPKHGSDEHTLEIKPSPGSPKGVIKAIPVGTDGAKIRGARFYCLLMDEFVQIPSKIIDTVLSPMAITKLDPMKAVRELEHKMDMIRKGLANDDDFGEDSVNKLIGTSSGFYKFNHMYKRMREYWAQIEEGSKDHAVFQVPYMLLPDGFLDPKIIVNQKRIMSDHEFRMEYLAEMVSDSEGFFKASLIEGCSNADFEIEMTGQDGDYILGVDPNQGGKAETGIVVVKLGADYNKVVRVLGLPGKQTQDIVRKIQKLTKDFNIVRIYMDKGGGGFAVGNLLEEGYGGKEPILDRNNKDNIRKVGSHILEIMTFSTSWIETANYQTLALFQDRTLRFPKRSDDDSEKYLKEYKKIEDLKKQCINIVLTQTGRGALHFDTPKRGQNKDLYSALILAGYGCKIIGTEIEEDENILYGNSGMVRERGSQWMSTNNNPEDIDYEFAIPKRK
jgi:hypothetical protein